MPHLHRVIRLIRDIHIISVRVIRACYLFSRPEGGKKAVRGGGSEWKPMRSTSGRGCEKPIFSGPSCLDCEYECLSAPSMLAGAKGFLSCGESRRGCKDY
jgi:hypothetical protein